MVASQRRDSACGGYDHRRVSQIPGGALTDSLKWKRGLAAVGILMIGTAALILALAPTFVTVFIAEILHGTTAGIITPAIAAISLGLVGRGAMSVRTGRNYRFAAAGHAATAALMGASGALFSINAMFVAAAMLCVPALFFLSRIRADEIDYARARNANKKQGANITRVFDLAKKSQLGTFCRYPGAVPVCRRVDPAIGRRKSGERGA